MSINYFYLYRIRYIFLTNLNPLFMKKITLTIGIFISLMLNAQDIIWEEGFEAYQDFDIAIPEWNQWDLDSSPTYGYLLLKI